MRGQQLWVGLVGRIIVVRVRGLSTVESVMERHTRVLQIAGESGSKSVLFDFLESDPPTFEVKQAQQQVNAELKALALRVAVLVSDYRLAYHGRIAFGDSSHRIVYDDMEEAILWLTQGGAQDEDRPA